MRPRLSFTAVLLFIFTSTSMAVAQKLSTREQLAVSRATYYTPTTSGLNSFSCNVDFDWKSFLEKASGETVEDTSPFLVYAKGVRLSISDKLHGAGRLLWATNGLPPDSVKQTATQVQSGMVKMIAGFFQTWNSFMNGGMTPAPGKSTDITATGEGYVVKWTEAGAAITENFDKNFLLKDVHMLTDSADVMLYPTYTDSPDGRIISVIRGLYRIPVTAPPSEISMDVHYEKVSSYQLPSSIILTVKNAGSFPFQFKECSVNH